MATGGTNITDINDLYATWAGEEDDRRAQQDRLKDLFGEAKDQGYNPKSLRAAFRIRYAEDHEGAKEREKRDRNDADLELYLTALARVREDEPDHDPETGEIREPSDKVTKAAAVPDAPTSLPADTVEDQRPATAKTPDQEPSEAEGSAGVQDRCESTPAPLLQEGSEPTEAHTLGRAGSTPAPATSPEKARDVAPSTGDEVAPANAGAVASRAIRDATAAAGPESPDHQVGSDEPARSLAQEARGIEPFKTDAQRALEIARARLEAKAIAEGKQDGPVQVPRPEGCQHTEACHSSSWRYRCHECETAFIAARAEPRAA